jgi:hypothetical protein
MDLALQSKDQLWLYSESKDRLLWMENIDRLDTCSERHFRVIQYYHPGGLTKA